MSDHAGLRRTHLGDSFNIHPVQRLELRSAFAWLNADLPMHRRRTQFVLRSATRTALSAYHRDPNVLLRHGTLLDVVEHGERIVLM